MKRLALVAALTTAALASGCEHIPSDSYGIRRLRFHHVEAMDDAALRACLATRERQAFQVDIGTSSELECNVPPFDGGRLPVRLVTWPWTDWPTFDQSVFERDLDRIERWYRARGYYDARVTEVQMSPERARTEDELPPTGDAGCERRHGDEGCPLEIDIHVHEGEPVLVRHLMTTGDALLQRELRGDIADAQQLRVGHPFDEALHDQTKQHMVTAMREAGYACAAVQGVVELDPTEHVADVTYTVRAGEISHFREVRVEVEGEVGRIPLDVVRAVSGIQRGDRFTPSRIASAQRAVYALGAFSSVEVESVPVDEATTPPSARLRSSSRDERGAQTSSGDLVVEPGHDETPPSAEEPAPSDDPNVLPSATADEQAAETRTTGTCGRDVDVVIHVTPGREIRYGLGAGLDSGTLNYFASSSSSSSVPQWNVHLVARFEHRNLFGGLRRLRIEERPKYTFQHVFPQVWDDSVNTDDRPRPGNELMFEFRQPAFIERMTTLTITGRSDLGADPIYGGYRHLLDVGAAVQRSFWQGHISVSLGAYGSKYDIIDRPNGTSADDVADYALSYLHQYVLLDLRDTPQNTHRGFMASAEVSEAGLGGFASWRYIRAVGEVRGFVPLPYRFTIATRFSMGAMVIYQHDSDLGDVSAALGPTAFRLRGGGPNSNRGFVAGSLGDEYNGTFKPIDGGLRRWEGSLEVRSRITDSFGLVTFADVGDVNRAPAFRFNMIHLTLGFGLRYFTIVGPVRLDFGFRVRDLQDVGSNDALTTDHPMIRNSRVHGAVAITIGDAF